MTNGCAPRKRRKRNRPEAALAAFRDESAPNLSSIVVLVELVRQEHAADGRRPWRQDLARRELAGLPEKGGNKHVDL